MAYLSGDHLAPASRASQPPLTSSSYTKCTTGQTPLASCEPPPKELTDLVTDLPTVDSPWHLFTYAHGCQVNCSSYAAWAPSAARAIRRHRFLDFEKTPPTVACIACLLGTNASPRCWDSPSSRLLPQRRVTQQVMTHWRPHVQSDLDPPSDRHALLRRLHQKQEVEAAPNAEEDDLRHSILCAGMARDSSQPRTLHWSPAAWLSCLSNVDGVMAFTTGEWESWFCMFLGLPLPSMCG